MPIGIRRVLNSDEENRIGIFGGTFNPIHIGHLIVAEHVRLVLGLTSVVFIPSSIPPHKKEFIDAKHRLNMANLACVDNPSFQVSDIELKRDGLSYTLDTMKQIVKEYEERRSFLQRQRDVHFMRNFNLMIEPSNIARTEFFFILGSDSFLDIEAWNGFKELLEICNFAVFTRPDKFQTPMEVAREVQSLCRAWGLEYSSIVADPNAPNFKTLITATSSNDLSDVNIISGPRLDISSTGIRNMISSHIPVRHVIHHTVHDYIKTQHLYLGDNKK